MSNENKTEPSRREEVLQTAVNNADKNPTGDNVLKFYDAAADTLRHKDPSAKAVTATTGNYVDGGLKNPDAQKYLTAIAADGNFWKDKNTQIHSGTPEQEAAAVELLKKYGVSDPTGQLATGLANSAVTDAQEQKAHAGQGLSVMSPVATSSYTSPAANLIVTSPKPGA
jgi:hypothetical protein